MTTVTLLGPFLDGALAGLTIAMPIGPMAMLCMQRTMADGMAMGVSTGLGAATMNVMSGAAVMLGLGTVAPWLEPANQVLDGLGGLVLLRSAARILRPPGGHDGLGCTPVQTRRAAFASALMLSATNPASLFSILALLAPLRSSLSPGGVALVLAGMFAAAVAWWVCFSLVVTLLRTRLSPGVLRALNRAAAVLLTVYAARTLARSAGRVPPVVR